MSVYDGKEERCVECGCGIGPGLYDFYPDGSVRCNDKEVCEMMKESRQEMREENRNAKTRPSAFLGP